MIEHLGPYSIAIASLIGTVVSYFFLNKQKKGAESHIEIMEQQLNNLDEQNIAIRDLIREKGIGNQIEAKKIYGLKALIQESIEHTDQFKLANKLIRENITSTYLPKINILHSEVLDVIYSKNENILPFKYIDKTGLSIDRQNLKILNVGLASANNINFSFNYDTNKVSDLIHENDVGNNFEISIQNKFLQIKNKKTNSSMAAVLVTDRSVDANYMLPVSVSEKPFLLTLPPLYIDLFCLFILTLPKAKEFVKQDPFDKISDFPKLELTAKYLDLAKNEYVQKFQIECEIYFITYGNLTNDREFSKINIKTTEIELA